MSESEHGTRLSLTLMCKSINSAVGCAAGLLFACWCLAVGVFLTSEPSNAVLLLLRCYCLAQGCLLCSHAASSFSKMPMCRWVAVEPLLRSRGRLMAASRQQTWQVGS